MYFSQTEHFCKSIRYTPSSYPPLIADEFAYGFLRYFLCYGFKHELHRGDCLLGDLKVLRIVR